MILGNKNPMDVNVDISQLEIIECPSCTGKLFTQVHLLKRVPKIMVGAPQDIPVSIPLWRCTNCGTVLLDFVPKIAGITDNLLEDGDEQSV